ncbi:MAG: sortase [Chloroflexi bacterium]|nr:sortase [Chloroflexota bacterium]
MNQDRRFRQTLVIGGGIALLGLVCLIGGIGLLAWRLIHPDEALILPPGAITLTEIPPTAALLGTPLAPPPLPDNPAQVAILPVSERATPTPTFTSTIPASISPTLSPGFALPSPTRTLRPAVSPVVSPAVPTLQATMTLLPAPLFTSTAAPPDRILIDAINLDAPVIPVGQHPITLDDQVYSQWDVPNFRAAGWHQNSAPLGQPGNTVFNGHHNTSGEVFRWLSTLKPGNFITIEAGNRRYSYVVVQTMTLAEEDQPVQIRQQNARWILPTSDERVTLVTCWPYSANTHRLVVIALPLTVVIPPGPIP